MFGVNYLPTNVVKTSTSLINYQSVRNVRPRKPFWLGIAKSKIDKVPERRTYRNKEEEAEFMRLKRVYGSEIKAIKKFIRITDPLLPKHLEPGNEEVQHLENIQKKIEYSIQMNSEFNAKSAELREKRLEVALQAFSEKAEKKMKAAEERDLRRKELIEETVRLEKLKSKSYITLENLDEAIERCLSNEVEYNFAIDLNGNKYIGKEPLVKIFQQETQVKEAETNN